LQVKRAVKGRGKGNRRKRASKSCNHVAKGEKKKKKGKKRQTDDCPLKTEAIKTEQEGRKKKKENGTVFCPECRDNIGNKEKLLPKKKRGGEGGAVDKKQKEGRGGGLKSKTVGIVSDAEPFPAVNGEIKRGERCPLHHQGGTGIKSSAAKGDIHTGGPSVSSPSPVCKEKKK